MNALVVIFLVGFATSVKTAGATTTVTSTTPQAGGASTGVTFCGSTCSQVLARQRANDPSVACGDSTWAVIMAMPCNGQTVVAPEGCKTTSTMADLCPVECGLTTPTCALATYIKAATTAANCTFKPSTGKDIYKDACWSCCTSATDTCGVCDACVCTQATTTTNAAITMVTWPPPTETAVMELKGGLSLEVADADVFVTLMRVDEQTQEAVKGGIAEAHSTDDYTVAVTSVKLEVTKLRRRLSATERRLAGVRVGYTITLPNDPIILQEVQQQAKGATPAELTTIIQTKVTAVRPSYTITVTAREETVIQAPPIVPSTTADPGSPGVAEASCAKDAAAVMMGTFALVLGFVVV